MTCTSSELQNHNRIVEMLHYGIVTNFILLTSSFHMAGFACILELLAEPLYILSQNLLLLRLRLIVETAATLLRCTTTYVLIASQIDMVNFYIQYFASP